MQRLTRPGKKAPIFWDSEGVDGGKSSLRVRGSDRNNGNTKKALLKQMAAGIKIVIAPAILCREKINTLEKQYREAQDFLAATGAGITDEKDLRAIVQKRCPYYYELHDVMINRPSSRPKITSDDLDAEATAEHGEGGAIVQQGVSRPLPLRSSQAGNKGNTESVERLLNQQAEVLCARGEQREMMMVYQKHNYNLKEKEFKLKEEKNAPESAKREAVVQLLLSRKKIQDDDVELDDIVRLLPLPPQE
ncbi:hypothetical protein PHYSODRAFT_317903 [Phytophthora sojae]|uniref:Uncharacterized protein n=1 Tax=Phytophthora sojae (strain P6497) TaxID=1094619 RepID=G5A1V1_PHYSP|nr:hypothetical protein PHYSODRAFT_317903 [Phytophthora sojae]EGZ10899.1 hypothetical protein PHYSODRAFT_317903 [Phytophthora sojae]|eukprot:XP_009533644.1 hypothetical protein PHYSODRAFT_317903 [Phytophthora sojae]